VTSIHHYVFRAASLTEQESQSQQQSTAKCSHRDVFTPITDLFWLIMILLTLNNFRAGGQTSPAWSNVQTGKSPKSQKTG